MKALSRLLALAPVLALGMSATSPAAQSAACGTPVPPGLVVNTTWTKAGSPYCVQGDIQVSLLKIEPGVRVLVEGDFSIDVLSTIAAIGTSAEPIVFTSKDVSARWTGIRLVQTQPGSVFEHCRIERARGRGLKLTNSVPVLRHCVFEDNESDGYGGGLWAEIDNGDLVVEDCGFLDNASSFHGGGVYAKMENGFALELVRCLFRGNSANPTNALANTVGGALYLIGRGSVSECPRLRLPLGAPALLRRQQELLPLRRPSRVRRDWSWRCGLRRSR